MVSIPAEELWEEYSQTRAQDARNSLVLKYLDLVKHNAEKIHAKLPSSVMCDDLVSAGTFGLLEAVESFDISRGVRFETFATLRIRGAIMDELRDYDRVPRLARKRSKLYETALGDLEKLYGTSPSRDEIRGHIGLSEEEFQRVERDARITSELSIDKVLNESEETESQICGRGLLIDNRYPQPDSLAIRKDLANYLTRGLSRKERITLILYYYNGMTMAEIGATLGVSEAYVCKMHKDTLDRLRKRFLNTPYDELAA